MTTTVTNLSTGEERSFQLGNIEALVSAYAQSIGDFDSTGYQKYQELVDFGVVTAAIGDWCVLLRTDFRVSQKTGE